MLSYKLFIVWLLLGDERFCEPTLQSSPGQPSNAGLAAIESKECFYNVFNLINVFFLFFPNKRSPDPTIGKMRSTRSEQLNVHPRSLVHFQVVIYKIGKTSWKDSLINAAKSRSKFTKYTPIAINF